VLTVDGICLIPVPDREPTPPAVRGPNVFVGDWSAVLAVKRVGVVLEGWLTTLIVERPDACRCAEVVAADLDV